MTPDKNRSRGTTSRCLRCHRAYSRIAHLLAANQRGTHPHEPSAPLRERGEAYGAAYAIARAWTDSGHNPDHLHVAAARRWPAEVWTIIARPGFTQDDAAALIQHFNLPTMTPYTATEWAFVKAAAEIPPAAPDRTTCCGAPTDPNRTEPTGKYATRHRDGWAGRW